MSQAHSDKRGCRPPLTGCLALVVLAVLAVTAWVWWDSQRGWTVAKLERLIAAEVPPHGDRQQVEAWFNRHGIEHWYIPDKSKPWPGPGSSITLRLAGLRDEDVSALVAGKIEGPEANVGFLQSGRIWVYFFLDKQGRVVGHLVRPFVYSL
jgi:hypothetical protein